MTLGPEDTIAVVGAGTMGAGIAQVAATFGHRVTVIDRDQAALERGRASVAKSLQQSVAKGRLGGDAAAQVEARIAWSVSYEEAAGSRLAIEAVVESEAVKRSVFEGLEAVMADDAILASNTSSLSIAQIAANLAHPQRFLGLHFFNPVPAMKLVEVVAGPATEPAAATALSQLMSAWGKHPVAVVDAPGFIVNRVARPYYAEAFAALGEVDPAMIDLALTKAAGFPMGPLALSDLIGQDVNYTVAATVFGALKGERRFRLQPAQKALVDLGNLGRKTGRGVFGYAAGDPPPQPTIAPPSAPPENLVVGEHDTLVRALCAAAGTGPTLWSDRDRAVIGAVAMATSDGRPLSARDDVDVLVDVVRDLDKAQVVAFTARSEQAASAAAGLIQAGGRTAIQLPDRAGLIVLRTLAQLANAAADAWGEGVADLDAIDAAMRLGAGHPEGPLTWARRFGNGEITRVLQHIANSTGDAIYEPSPHLSRMELSSAPAMLH
jgi:3-hydroxybutyryl-CoA dehydrogenase